MCDDGQERTPSTRNRCSGKLGELCRSHPWVFRVLVVSLALIAVVVAVAVSWPRGTRDAGTAAASGCREDWIGYRGMCYYLSRDEGSWDSSQHNCSSLGASLAVIKREWEVLVNHPIIRQRGRGAAAAAAASPVGGAGGSLGPAAAGERLTLSPCRIFSGNLKAPLTAGLACGEGTGAWCGWTTPSTTKRSLLTAKASAPT
ncbi:killer cell lectin-like receptor subfamily G member 2 isoform X3 [Rhea pennata]|uniref:killer cell lectin-like receptor subfamily G member 2 isoform X3 n=1 Tax=Rhea pennata TaxID=8795 RepID=UPI002E259D9C